MATHVATPSPGRSDRLIHSAAVLLCAAVFATDLQLPLGNAVGMLYVPVILLGLWTRWRHYALVAAVAATALLGLSTALAWTGEVAPLV